MAGANLFRKGRKGGTGPAAGARSHDDTAPVPAAPTAFPAERITRAVQGRGRPASLAAEVRRGAGKVSARSGALSRAKLRGLLAAVADRIIDTAPRIPVRDLATLRAQFPGLPPEELADKLVVGACRGSATVGAGVGAAAMLPVPPAMPAELAAEVVGVASVEIKLIAELHEVYGLRPAGNLKQRATAYLTSWTEERGIEVTKPATVNAALGGQLKRELRQQIMKRTLRNLPNLAPFMIGAAVGAFMNRRDTRKLADRVRRDLRARRVPWDVLPGASRDALLVGKWAGSARPGSGD
ncbi:hypothetical protein [Streptomyces halobius]|uniref:EcsC family protein n=1 Tax=Streptomyces halobius TaxID=2879846 RepID=A0ABY4M593_9ACTN|nr:hypothetical protein [Streptomyces halobius]UQA92632.1 hypothetical protein K9S39_13065 [Streptomyces halobius]